MSSIASNNDWMSTVTEGDVLQARIIFVDHANKSIRLSYRPHILYMRTPMNLPPLGIYNNNYY